MSEVEEQDFASGFARWARRVRAHNAARHLGNGLTAGLLVGVLAAGIAWWTRDAELRLHALWLGVCGLLIGAWIAKRKSWSDEHVALFLDHRLDTEEVVTTALELQRDGDEEEEHVAYQTVLREARDAMTAQPRSAALPRITQRTQLLGPAAAAAIVAIGLAPLPPAPPAPPPPPGSETVKLSELSSLDEVIKLSDLIPEDEAQAKRLRELSKRAKTLKKRLKEGIPKREALDEIAKLRDAVAHERRRFGTGKERAGLESALAQLRKNPQLDKARKALGDRDMTSLDQEMRRLANQLEKEDRERAEEALKKAAEAAKKRGAPHLARTLEEQRRQLAEAGEHSDKLRELAKALEGGLSEEAKRALKEMNSSGDPKASRELSKALAKALGQLSEEERKQLAEKLRERAKDLDPNGGGSQSLSAEDMKKMAEKLSTPEGQKQLAEALREQAKPPPPGQEGARQRQLGNAEKGLGQTERKLLGGAPMPLPGQGQSGGNTPGKSDSNNKAPLASGPSRGGGPGEHDGHTKKVEGDSLRSHARSPMSPGAPNPGTVHGRTVGRAGETANHRGERDIGRVGPSEVGAIERSDVPKEYREQVGRYFQP